MATLYDKFQCFQPWLLSLLYCKKNERCEICGKICSKPVDTCVKDILDRNVNNMDIKTQKIFEMHYEDIEAYYEYEISVLDDLLESKKRALDMRQNYYKKLTECEANQ